MCDEKLIVLTISFLFYVVDGPANVPRFRLAFFFDKFLIDIEIICIFYSYLLSGCCLSYGIMINDKYWIEQGPIHWLPSQIYRHVKRWKPPSNYHCFCGFQKPVCCVMTQHPGDLIDVYSSPGRLIDKQLTSRDWTPLIEKC